MVSFLAAGLFYVTEPVVTMREQPTLISRVVSQTIFSENVQVTDKNNDWVYIVTPDHYTGWILANALTALDKPYHGSVTVSRLSAHLYGVKDTEFGAIQTLPYGATLAVLDATDARWIKVVCPDGKECYIQKGDVALEKQLHEKGELVAFSQRFQGLPYTWGGRSSFGYDCSGFVQMLYSKIGIDLQRDSKLQVSDPRFRSISIDQLESGDLIFFGKAKDKISHVGMYVGNGQFIHSTVKESQPWIHISNLSDAEWSGEGAPNTPYRVFRQLI